MKPQLCEHLLGEPTLGPLPPPGSPALPLPAFCSPSSVFLYRRPRQEGAGGLTARQPKLVACSPLWLL